MSHRSANVRSTLYSETPVTELRAHAEICFDAIEEQLLDKSLLLALANDDKNSPLDAMKQVLFGIDEQLLGALVANY